MTTDEPMKDPIYLDTRPGAPGAFAPSAAVDDYAQWLRDRYRNCQQKDGSKRTFFGAGQRINQVLQAGKHETPIFAIGPYAGDAAAVLEAMAGQAFPQLRAELERMRAALEAAEARAEKAESAAQYWMDVAEDWRDDLFQAIQDDGKRPGVTVDGHIVPVPREKE